jgi:nicotinate-nucleotide adenylyltransferase
VADVGILGGTFNPPHVGHLVMVLEALDQLALDRVMLMPVAQPPHKEAPADPGAAVRLELCRLAIAGEERVEVSDLEIERGGASYTVDTLRALHERDPEHALTFIVGGDMAYSLPSWREPEAILKLARLAVAERDGLRREDIAQRLEPLHAGDRVAFFDMPRIDLSSSAVRDRVAAGRPIRYLVPDPVVDTIRARSLYRQPAGRPAA